MVLSNCNPYPNGTENNDANFIGNQNPWRWRSQYFDTESGNYYTEGRIALW